MCQIYADTFVRKHILSHEIREVDTPHLLSPKVLCSLCHFSHGFHFLYTTATEMIAMVICFRFGE